MGTDKSSQQGLTTAQQLARLGLTKFFSRGSGLTPSMEHGGMGTMSNHGPGKGTKAGPVGELAWEIAQTAQSCAYLAIELQVLASRSYAQGPTLPESTYSQLSSSVGIFRGLLTNMHKKLSVLNKKEDNNAVCVISGDLAEAILSMWAADNLTTTVECMTKPASQETPDIDTAGDMK